MDSDYIHYVCFGSDKSAEPGSKVLNHKKNMRPRMSKKIMVLISILLIATTGSPELREEQISG
jgi:hypothetical protein